MRGVLRVIVVMVVISLGAWALRLATHGRTKIPPAHASLVGPRLTAQETKPAASGGEAPSPAPASATAPARLIYPDAAARHAMHVDYAVFDRRSDGSMMAVPLPPGSAWQTMLALDPAGHRQLVIRPMVRDSRCAFGVAIAVYQAGKSAPVWHGELPPNDTKAQQVVDLSRVGVGNPLLVSLKMADRATNNWSCNVILTWDDANGRAS